MNLANPIAFDKGGFQKGKFIMALASVCGFQLPKHDFTDIPTVLPSRNNRSLVPEDDQVIENFELPADWDVSVLKN